MSSSSLPVDAQYAIEAEVATSAVLRACHITQKVQKSLKKLDEEEKPDKSPVTVADYASQALLAHLLSLAFPKDALVGEEDTTSLRSDSAQATTMRARIVELVNEALALEGAGLGPAQSALSEDEVLAAIDRGSSNGGPEGRWWTCDPIDGTLGFLRGEQYAVCLTLVSSSSPVLGLIACPNLAFPSVASPTTPGGSIFLASAGHGSYQRSLASPTSSFERIHLPAAPEPPYAILESVEASHSSHAINASIGASVGLGERLRMDSQAKYGALARGDGALYLRVPTRFSGGKVYEEKIWDHASGWLLVREAGGEVTDCWGRPLDFGKGRTLKENDGVIATAKGVHGKTLAAVRKAILSVNPGLEPPTASL